MSVPNKGRPVKADLWNDYPNLSLLREKPAYRLGRKGRGLPGGHRWTREDRAAYQLGNSEEQLTRNFNSFGR